MKMGLETRLATVAVVALVLVTTVQGECKDKKEPSFTYLKELEDECHLLPQNWRALREVCEDLPQNRQSPVVLDLSKCERQSAEDAPLKFEGFDQSTVFKGVNNGHSVSFEPKPAATMTVSGGNLKDVYVVHSFHFHWGNPASDELLGSEHRIKEGGTELPTLLELHIVTSKKGLTFEKAKETTDGIAVIGILFQKGETVAERDSAVHVAFESIGAMIENVIHPHNDASEVSLKLEDLLPKDKPLKFINYDGSLTTPTCNPVVQWNVIHPPVRIGPALIEQFTKITYDGKVKMTSNYRPVMKLHGRPLRCFF